MYLRSFAFLQFLLLAFFPAHAEEKETALWKNVGTWSVYIDRTVQYQCFIATIYEDYTIFRVGFQQPGSDSTMYVALGNLDWTSIEEGKDYELILQIDNETGWRSPARGFRFGTLPALIVGTNQADFVEQMMRRHSLRVHFNGQQILNLSLRGSNAALRELGNCQNQVDAYLGIKNQENSKDPFSGVAAPAPKKDPFAF